MSEFTPAELEYLGSQSLARIATVGPDGQPHVSPVTFRYNPDEDVVDVGGVAFGETKKWRDARSNPRVTLIVDDVVREPKRRARAVEVRGTAEAHESGGESINPRFPNFAPEFLRIRPTRIVAWGIEEAAEAGAESIGMNARDVG